MEIIYILADFVLFACYKARLSIINISLPYDLILVKQITEQLTKFLQKKSTIMFFLMYMEYMQTIKDSTRVK